MTDDSRQGGARIDEVLKQMPVATRLFALESRERDGLHSHGYHQISFCEHENAMLLVDGRAVDIERDGAILVPSGTVHAFASRFRCEIHCVYFEAPLPTASVSTIALSGLIKELMHEVRNPAAHEHSRRLLATCLYDQIATVLRAHLREDTALTPALDKVCRLVLDELASNVSVRELARTVCVSERTLSRLARSELGCSITQFRTRSRVFEAVRLLGTGMPIKQVSPHVGFASESAFFAAFKSVTGRTPAQVRRDH